MIIGKDGLERRHVHRMLGTLKDIIGHLLADALVDDKGDANVVPPETFGLVGHLRVWIVLLQVGQANLRRCRRQIGVAVEIPVLELGLLGNLGFAKLLISLDNQGTRETHFPLDEKSHLDASRVSLRIGIDFLEFTGGREGFDIARHRHRIVGLTDLGLTTTCDG